MTTLSALPSASSSSSTAGAQGNNKRTRADLHGQEGSTGGNSLDQKMMSAGGGVDSPEVELTLFEMRQLLYTLDYGLCTTDIIDEPTDISISTSKYSARPVNSF
ncbi:unnamed protein product [Amoebophrya sp. A25]|nr:unnamed protein product [Amoebophrya sp. A25]|eukprot:GSA25T00000213001.1